ncbi:hypothetical protein ACMFMG_009680 [Clarireedia jacksonii]
MSNLTDTLIAKLQLQRLLCERVFVKWEDQSGIPFTLGSRLNDNKQNLKFLISVYYDMEGHIHIHFSLKVSIILHSRKHEMEMLLVVPPDADFADVSTPCLLSNIDDLSCLDASAIHDAEISDSVYVICIPFDLTTKGFVIMKKKTPTTFKSYNTTSKKLIHSFESLSNTKTFTVYIKPNDYAQVGLKELHNRLSNTGIHKINMKEMYVQQDVVLVEWSGFDPVLLPLYTENPTQLLPEVQVPRSPPIEKETPPIEKETPIINTIEVVIAETPTRTRISPSPTPVLHGIFSPGIEEPTRTRISPSPAPVLHGIFSPSIEEPTRTLIRPNVLSPHSSSCPSIEEWHSIEEDLRHLEEGSRYIAMDCNVDSDEEYLASLNSREQPSQQAVSKMLGSKFVEWIHRARQINSKVYKHRRLAAKLSILGNCVRTSNTRVFDATVPWCSALLFYDPLDSDNTRELWEERNRWLISDIAELVGLANEHHSGAEMSSRLVNHFVKLGDTARIVALHPGYNKDEYELQKSLCIAYIFMEFGKPGTDMSKSVSRKSLEDSSPSKRVKI